jgi:hypothetical protein
MPSPAERAVKRAAARLPSPLLRVTARVAVKVLFPIAGVAATAAVHRARWHLAARRTPDGTVVVDIDRGLQVLAPEAGDPPAPLMALADRAHLTLAGKPGGSVTHLRAVPKRAGEDILGDVNLAKHRLEAET